MRSEKLEQLCYKFPEWKIFLIALFFFIASSLFIPRFWDLHNITTIVVQMAPVGILAVGMTFIIITGGIDLSVGSLVAMISVLMAGDGHYPVALMIVIALFWGLVAGAVNGAFVSIGKLSPFIVTLSTMAASKGVALWVSNTEEHVIRDPNFSWLGSGTFLTLPIPFWIFILVTFVGQFVLSKTVFGKAVFASGSNPVASLHAGVPVDRIRFLVYLISGFLASISAIVVSSRLNISTPTLGEFYELDAIAAVIIGGTSLFGGRGSVIGTLIGVFIFGIITNVLNLSGTSPHMQRIAKGVVILLAVLMQSGGGLGVIKGYFARWLPENVKDVSKGR